MKELELLVTLWPSFPHFTRFAYDGRLAGIRLNSAMVKGLKLTNELELAKAMHAPVPLYFDIKGRQLRVTEVIPSDDHLELILNHPISVETPNTVLFKAGEDPAWLLEVKDGTHLIFEGGPKFKVYEGESLHIRHPSLKVSGSVFCDYEIEKMEKARKYGFDKFFLSYVESQQEIDEFREYIGKDSEVICKIESVKGLEFVANKFKPQPSTSLMAARGDLYVELDWPHQIMDALKLIISKDPNASVGSRFFLTVENKPFPECSDFLEIAWMYDIGYRKMMLCDGLCLKEGPLSRAINAFDSFRKEYVK